MREKSSASDSARVRTSMVLPRPGTPSSNACEPASTQVITPSTTSRLPTMTRAISSRSVPTCLVNVCTSSRASSTGSLMIGSSGVGSWQLAVGSSRGARASRADHALVECSVARPDQLKVAPDVETIARRNFVLGHDLLGHGLIIGEDLLVALAHEPALGGSVNHLGGGGALAAVDAGGRHVLRLAVELRRIAGEVVVVAVAGALADAATGRVGLAVFAGGRRGAGHGHVDAGSIALPA